MGLHRFARVAVRVAARAIALTLLFAVAPSDAAPSHHSTPLPSSSPYRFGGIVYDRAFSVNTPRFAQRALQRSWNQRPASPRPPYAITNLAAVFTGYDGPLTGFPTAVNNGGLITFYDECFCFGYPPTSGNAGIVTDDQGDEISEVPSECCEAGLSDAIPYAINAAGISAGEFSYTVGGFDSFSGNVTWSFGGGTLYFGGADNGSATFAINDNNVAVGVDVGLRASSRAPTRSRRTDSCGACCSRRRETRRGGGVATGIDDAGEIVGYATLGNGSGRAVRFFENGYAQVIPVGAPGMSTSAQAINSRGDVVGNAGSEAFLYYTRGRSYDLDTLIPAGKTVVTAVGIDDAGQNVGTAYAANEPYDDFGFSMLPRLIR